MPNKSKYYVIIVAGGNGSRMDTDIPKQFLNLLQKPVLMHTIEAFYKSYYKPNILLVLAKKDIIYWKELVSSHSFNIPHEIIVGGDERFYSVKNGLSVIKDSKAIIAIHDAVRPLVSQAVISDSYLKAASIGNGIAAIPTKDSVRRKISNKTSAIPRDEVFLVQTPQSFQYSQLNDAYAQNFSKNFTDDASVVENFGYEINLSKGEEINLKITFPDDLLFAEMILKRKGEF